jgi:uncharacterized protein HemY
MKDIFDNILSWVKSNMLMAIGIVIAVIVLLFPRMLKKLFRSRPHSDAWYTRAARERRKAKRQGKPSYRLTRMAGRRTGRYRKKIPRSAGNINRRIKSGPNAGKKAWQIKGSPEARRHMAAIRRRKR